MKTVFLVNRTAGRNRAGRIWEEVRVQAQELFEGSMVFYTQGPGHARELALRYPGSRILVVGGDGTFHDALQGAVPGDCQMGILPAGSGNDLARCLGIPREPREALRVLAGAHTRRIDLGRMGPEGAEPEYFVNGAGIGFDARAAYDMTRVRALRGKGAYLLAILGNLLFFRGVEVQVRGRGGYRFDGRILCLIAGNGEYLGGGIRVAPGARPDDGKLSFILIHDVSLARRVVYLRRVLAGRHTAEPFVETFEDTDVEVACGSETLYHQDGEVSSGRTIRIAVCPGALQVLSGKE